jgi:hypothetical protein
MAHEPRQFSDLGETAGFFGLLRSTASRRRKAFAAAQKLITNDRVARYLEQYQPEPFTWGPTAICVPTEGFSRGVQATLASVAAVSLMAGPEHDSTIPVPDLSQAKIPRCGEP